MYHNIVVSTEIYCRFTINRLFYLLHFVQYSITPFIRTLVIRIANYPDRSGPSLKFCQEFYKTNLSSHYRLSDQVQHSVMAYRTTNQARSKGLEAGTYWKY